MDENIQECMNDIFEQSTNIKYGEAKAEPEKRQQSFKVKKSDQNKGEKKKGCAC